MKTSLAVAAVLLPLSQGTASAWNIPGHMLSAAIPYQILQQESPQTIDKVKAILALHPWHSTRWQNSLAPFAGADTDVMLFMLASRWADDIRTTDKFQRKFSRLERAERIFHTA